MILCTEEPEDFMRKLLELINKFSKVAGYKINTKNLLCFFTLIMNYQNEKIRKQVHR